MFGLKCAPARVGQRSPGIIDADETLLELLKDMWRFGAIQSTGRIAALLLLFCCLAGRAQSQVTALHQVRNELLTSQYLLLEIKEQAFDDELLRTLQSGSVGGGAFFPRGQELIYVTSSGHFLLIDLAHGQAKMSFLPALDLGIDAFHKHYTNFETEPRTHDIVVSGASVYVSFDRFETDDNQIHFEIARASAGQPSWTVVYRSIGLDQPYYTLSSGGAMQIRGRQLYFSIGDFSSDQRGEHAPDSASQNPRLPWGKFQVLDLDSLSVSLVSLGHRNPQGITLLSDGRLLSSEQGPRGGDKLNVILPGKNYGWPVVSSGTQYLSLKPIGQQGAKGKFEPPVYEFSPSIAPTQLAQALGFDPLWDGDVLLATLKAQTLYRIRLAQDRVLSIEPIFIGQRIRDIKQVGKNIVLLTDNLSFITLAPVHDQRELKAIESNGALEVCGTCHSFNVAGGNAFAPNLTNLLGRPIASTDFANYSAALRAAARGRVWDPALLKAFILSPSTFAPGTTMPDIHFSDGAADNVVKIMRKRQDAPSPASAP